MSSAVRQGAAPVAPTSGTPANLGQAMARRQCDGLMLDEPLAESVVQQLGELLARLEALLRSAAQHETVLRVGPLELDLLTRVVHRGHRELELLPREFKLLEYMMRHEGQVLTRAMLLEQVWNYRFVPQTNLVDVHIGRLRRKLDEPGDTPMILSVRGVGFILHAPA
jgi:two-component system OmpR family response regulator